MADKKTLMKYEQVFALGDWVKKHADTLRGRTLPEMTAVVNAEAGLDFVVTPRNISSVAKALGLKIVAQRVVAGEAELHARVERLEKIVDALLTRLGHPK